MPNPRGEGMSQATFEALEEHGITSEQNTAHGHSHHGPSSRSVVVVIAAILAFFALSTAKHWTKAWVDHGHSEEHGEHGDEHGAHGHGDAHEVIMPALYAVTPFVLLLGSIALLPLLRATEHWWESNLHRFYVAAGLALLTLVYYLLLHTGGGFDKVVSVLQHAILIEYIPFIVLLFALYTISGGIRIEGDMAAHPLTNSTFILVGGLLASFIGTTGAAMLLIRPLLETNRERKNVQHTVVFFIFVVCNCGGCLLPIGDPPLFLGYLRGVDFMWTMWNLWLPWIVVNALLIAIYYVWDRFFCYPKETKPDIRRDETQLRPLRISGLWPNALLLVGIILSVALLDSSKDLVATLSLAKLFPGLTGVEWHPWPFLREAVQLGLVALSLLLGSEKVRSANKFNYHAIVEVAALFIGIFICMQPALEILNVKGGELGLTQPWQMFWATGGLSAVLDNAPTYVVFFETAATEFHGENFSTLVSGSGETATRASELLIGISLGAVFLGAMTYIGNGPNFMVKAIAEQSGIKMPSFFGYVIRYSVPVLIPVFIVATLLFLL